MCCRFGWTYRRPDVRGNVLLFDQPCQVVRRTVGAVCGQGDGLYAKAGLRPLGVDQAFINLHIVDVMYVLLGHISERRLSGQNRLPKVPPRLLGQAFRRTMRSCSQRSVSGRNRRCSEPAASPASAQRRRARSARPAAVSGPVKLIDSLLAGHMTPSIGVDDLVAAAIFNGRPPRSIARLDDARINSFVRC
jgi:hypothetical protein